MHGQTDRQTTDDGRTTYCRITVLASRSKNYNATNYTNNGGPIKARGSEPWAAA